MASILQTAFPQTGTGGWGGFLDSVDLHLEFRELPLSGNGGNGAGGKWDRMGRGFGGGERGVGGRGDGVYNQPSGALFLEPVTLVF